MAKATEGIDVKGAVKVASAYLAQLYDKEQVRDVLLEEVRRSDDDRYWLITLGFSRPFLPPEGELEKEMRHLFSPALKREYKVFEIDSTSGEFHGMRIREV